MGESLIDIFGGAKAYYITKVQFFGGILEVSVKMRTYSRNSLILESGEKEPLLAATY